ncbi:MAG: alpha-L-fucosidase [Gemmatimonadaceae bacterium]
MNRRTFVRGSAASIAASIVASKIANASQFEQSQFERVQLDELHNGIFATKRTADRLKPSHSQLAWQRDEMAMFLHFGVNTFTDREWGDGTENPSIFNPTALDARQWVRSAKAGGFKSVILTAKHHDGFCLWPTSTTKHSVASSPFRGGTGDVVREFVNAVRAEGLRPGLYLSPWDRNNPVYGDSERYNDLYCAQLTELLTRYGKIAEVWFDGANGEGPNGKKQTYDWARTWALVRKLQPDAVIFSDAGPDVRWCGNENGSGGETNWSSVNPSVVTYPGASGPGVTESLQHGDATGTVWRPAEADTSIRPGWFYHSADDAKVRTVDNLYDLYFKSVGRNAKLLLNVPPTREGLLHATDIARLTALRERLTHLRESAVKPSKNNFISTGAHSGEIILDLGKSQSLSAFRLAEDIQHGQSISKWNLSISDRGDWKQIAKGTTIGYARMENFITTTASRVKLTIEDGLDSPKHLSIVTYG